MFLFLVRINAIRFLILVAMLVCRVVTIVARSVMPHNWSLWSYLYSPLH